MRCNSSRRRGSAARLWISWGVGGRVVQLLDRSRVPEQRRLRLVQRFLQVQPP